MPFSQALDRATLVKSTALAMAAVLLFGLAMRVLVVGSADPIATIIAWTSHGYRGSIIFAAPVLPLVASLMLDKRGTRNVAVIVSAILLFILSQHMSGNIQVDENFPEHIRYSMRALVLLMSMVAVTWIAGYYKLSQGKPDSPVATDHTHDPLTGLLTRGVIDQALQRECARARRANSWVSLALIEIDGYEELEPEYGPRGAELCLLGVADGLRYCMRRSSDALGVFAPHRLCILMSDTSDEGAVRVGEKFRQLIESLDIPVDNNRTTLLTVSIGVASFKQGSVAELVDEAEQALSVARDAGGNRTEVRILALPASQG